MTAMAEKYDPLPDLAALVAAGLNYSRDAGVIASRIGEQLGLGEDDTPETIAAELRKALGIPGPRSVVYDMTGKDPYNVLTAALEMLAADQRDRARGEGGNPRRHEWADLAERMMHQADKARNASGTAAG